jgi:hypothetical protein
MGGGKGSTRQKIILQVSNQQGIMLMQIYAGHRSY